MKIVDYKLYFVDPRWLFLKIETDEGITGWGEPVLEAKALTVAAAVDEMMDHLIGRDPLQIERHWQRMMKGGFYRGGGILNSAVAGIDQALWDIAGKKLGVPVHQLLGGHVRDRVRIYGHIGGKPSRDEHGRAATEVGTQELLESVQVQLDRGLTALKWCPADSLEHIDTAAELKRIVANVEAVRQYVGDEIDLCLDFHGRFSLAMSRRIFPLLEPYNLMFIEEPVLPEYTSHFGLVVESTSIPIATGERLFSRSDFADVLRTGIAVAQPDPSHAGGISETRRIAAMAETFNVNMAPHCPLGPIALAACLQLDFATPNFLIQEQILGLGEGNTGDLMKYLVDYSPFQSKDGYIELMKLPGLGIEIDEKEVRNAAGKGHRFRIPEWVHQDGSFAEW
ncbi:MAG: galactonate dehydratase [Actinobacteria bacterium]|nr:galactonate dehydratase [Actinomycetota bacterium]